MMFEEIAELRRLMKSEISDNNHDNARIIANAIDHIQQLEAEKARLEEELKSVRQDYSEIVMQIPEKHPHMSLHRHAVEIIKAHVNQENEPQATKAS